MINDNGVIIAQKSDCKTSGMPEKQVRFTLEIPLTELEKQVIKCGFIPKSNDDKWFWYYQDDQLYIHRSVSGKCLYILTFVQGNDTVQVTARRKDTVAYPEQLAYDKSTLTSLLKSWARPSADYERDWLHNLVVPEKLKINDKNCASVFFHLPYEPAGFLSNWFLSDFVSDGIRYTSAEQYIMHQKCLLFEDYASAFSVMKTDRPEQQQKIARGAKNYNETVWNGMRQIVLTKALLAKFSQNPDLKKKLLATKDCYLVECARSDKIWACGIGLYDERKNHIDNWCGKNILGFSLMQVRSLLSENDNEIFECLP